MRRIVHVTTVPQSLIFLRGQTSLMREHGFEVSFVSSPGAELDDFGNAEGAEVLGIEMPRRITPAQDLKSLGRLCRYFSLQQPDCVHAHTPKGGLLGTLAAKLSGVPVRIYHMRGLPLMGASGPQRALLTLTEWVSCQSASHVLAVSHGVRREAIRLRLCSADKIHVLGHGSGQGVDVTQFDPAKVDDGARRRIRDALSIPHGATVIGFVGRLVGDKGVCELAESWRQLRTEHSNLHLLIVGAFEPRDPVPLKVRAELERDERVHLVGFTNELVGLYRAMDVVVLPSYREGFPNVPLEAAAMELPVVGTTAVGMSEAIEHGRTGLTVPPGNAAALTGALREYIADAKLRRRHGKAGRARVLKYFSRNDVLGHLVKFYQRVLGDKQASVSSQGRYEGLVSGEAGEPVG